MADIVVSLPQSSVQALVARSGLNDNEIADHLNAELAYPLVRPPLVHRWRIGAGLEPEAGLLALLAQLSQPAAPRVLGRAS